MADEKDLTPQEAQQIERDFFEDGEVIRLRDGKVYTILPLTLRDARTLMKKLGNISVDAIILNYFENPETNKTAEEDLYDILMLAFTKYPDMTKEYMESIIDLNSAKVILEIMIGLNGLKK
jgi:hypothetical protein